jgi:hypothetical protein
VLGKSMPRRPRIGLLEKPSSNDLKGKIIFILADIPVGSCRTTTSVMLFGVSFRITARSTNTWGATPPMIAKVKVQAISLRNRQVTGFQ